MKAFHKKLLAVTLPIIVQNLLSSSLSFADTLMIGQIGENALAAVGVANQVFFLINLVFFGISSGTSIFLSQYYGAKDYAKMKKTMALAASICLLCATLVSLFSFFFPQVIMKLFTKDATVILLGNTYLRWVAVSYIFSSISTSFSIGFRSVTRSHIPMISTLISMLTNILLNAILIFGLGPLPALGVRGAAIATALSRLLEVVILISFAYRGEGEKFAFKGKADFEWNSSFVKTFFSTALPVVFNETFWSIGMILYKIAYSRLGTSAIATVNITESIANYFFIIALGLGNGSTVILGNTLGEGKLEEAKSQAREILLLCFLTGALMMVLELLFSPLFTSWFNVTSEASEMAIKCLRLNAVAQPLRGVSCALVVGVLRAGGDTKAAMACELSVIYFIGLPIAFILASLGYPLNIVYICTLIEEGGKIITGGIRYRQDKWRVQLAER